MKNLKSFLFIQVFIAVLLSSCQNIIKPMCYITLTNQSSQQVAYADVWLVAEKDSTKKIKLFEFEKLEINETSSVFQIDFSRSLSNEGYIEVNAKLIGNSKTYKSKHWKYKGDNFYHSLPGDGSNMLFFSVDDTINPLYDNIRAETANYKKGKIKINKYI